MRETRSKVKPKKHTTRKQKGGNYTMKDIINDAEKLILNKFYQKYTSENLQKFFKQKNVTKICDYIGRINEKIKKINNAAQLENFKKRKKIKDKVKTEKYNIEYIRRELRNYILNKDINIPSCDVKDNDDYFKHKNWDEVLDYYINSIKYLPNLDIELENLFENKYLKRSDDKTLCDDIIKINNIQVFNPDYNQTKDYLQIVLRQYLEKYFKDHEDGEIKINCSGIADIKKIEWLFPQRNQPKFVSNEVISKDKIAEMKQYEYIKYKI